LLNPVFARCHWDLPSITGECPKLFFDDIKSLKPDQWRMSLLDGNNIFSTASKGQTWQMFGIRLVTYNSKRLRCQNGYRNMNVSLLLIEA
jgi:hypothetical protein